MHEYEKRILQYLKEKKEDEAAGISGRLSLNRDAVIKTVYWLREKSLVEIKEESEEGYRITEEGKRFLSNGFPEVRLLSKAQKGVSILDLDDEERKIGLPWAKKNNWVRIENGKIIAEKTINDKYPLEEALRRIEKNERVEEKELLGVLVSRGQVERMEIKSTFVKLTQKGEKEKIEEGDEEGMLTREMLITGTWKEKKFRRYNILAEAGGENVGKIHPVSYLAQKIRNIFLEMGFEEMEGSILEESFWNFDALFQPQDHPARDMADTFYLNDKSASELEEKLVLKVKNAHESKWKEKWDMEKALERVLRTHTTAVSAHYCADIGKGKRKEGKYFCIGRVYRNEAIDFKHLAEFFQIEGIVVWDKANFRHLLGFLKEFYSKLGFEKIRFRPSYFPYTEPSLEVEVFFEPRQEWLELGGAGIFRREVCDPLWGKYPVLAWGLSLERPLMILMGLDDIRKLYKNELKWLREWRL